ncbi:MAG: nucleotidyltransferase family protein, partial [Ruminococcus sp.]
LDLKQEFTQQEKREYNFILKLLSRLFESTPCNLSDADIDYNRIFKITALHSIANMVSYALESSHLDVPKDNLDSFIKYRKFMLMKDASQFAATKKLIEAFEEQGIDNLLVKGQFIKDSYKQPDYRVMNDVDIHIRKSDFKRIKEIVTSMDYEVIEEKENLLIVVQQPFVQIELHGDNGEFRDTQMGENLFDIAMLKKGKSHTYQFSVNDHFVYIIEHYAKHFRDLGGMGIRMIADVYNLHNHYNNSLNEKYIQNKLTASGTYNFYKMLLNKCRQYFESGDKTITFDSVDVFIFSSMTFGREEVLYYNRQLDYQRKYMNNSDKENYILRRIFPPRKKLIEEYPSLKKTGATLPLVWVHRNIKLLFGKDKKNYKKNLELYKKYNDKSQLEYLLYVMKKAGF